MLITSKFNLNTHVIAECCCTNVRN